MVVSKVLFPGRHGAFKSVARGLDLDSFPMRLYELGKRLHWNPSEIDYSRDIEDWRRLSDAEKEIMLQTAAIFAAGEEAVNLDILPLLTVLSQDNEKYLEEVMYLSQFTYEEAKHVDAWVRFIRSIGYSEGTLAQYTTRVPSYRRFYYEELPGVGASLIKEPIPENIVRFCTTYNIVSEGVIAETGYYGFRLGYERTKTMPGLNQMVRYVARDEARHVAFGTYLISRMVAEHGDSAYEAFMKQMDHLIPITISLFEEYFKPVGSNTKGLFGGVDPSEFVEFSQRMINLRVSIIEKARNMTPQQVVRMSIKELGVEQ